MPAPFSTVIDARLNERGKTHGEFWLVAEIAQRLKATMRSYPKWQSLSHIQRESLELIATKIARVLAGNENHPDHWGDLAGYAELVVQELKRGTL
jgi:hypothetical protein